MKRTYIKTALMAVTGAIGLAGMSSPAAAGTVKITAIGKITSFVDTIGLYGAAGADYAGAAIKNVFFFNNPTDGSGVNGPHETFKTLYSNIGGGNVGSSTINGHTVFANIYETAYNAQNTLNASDIVEARSFSFTDTLAGATFTRQTAQQGLFLESTVPGTLPFSLHTSYTVSPTNPSCTPLCGSGFINSVIDTYDYPSFTLLNEQVDNAAFEITSFSINAVPEPASWALMLAGFGLTGAAMRRRRETVRVTFA